MLALSVDKKCIIKSLCVAALLAAVITAAAFVASSSVKDTAVCGESEYSLEFESEEEQTDFISQLGFDGAAEMKTTDEVIIPGEFNETYESYNKLQLLQGLDLEKYKGEKALRYIFEINGADYATDDNTAQNIYLCVLVYKGRVIGGHIESGLQGESLKTFFGDTL